MRLRNEILILGSAILLCLPAHGAGQQAAQQSGQQQNGQGSQQGQPLTPVSAAEPTQTPDEGQSLSTIADARSFGGAEGFTVKSSGLSRGYFLPSLQLSETGDSNFTLGSTTPSFETIETVVGRLDYKKVGRRNQTTLDYMGGGTFYNHHSGFNNVMQQFGITESYQGRRWSFLVDDRASYLPESAFGYGGFGFMGALGLDVGGAAGSNLSNLSSTLNPLSGLLTGRGSRTLNTTVVQVQYLAGARSSLNLSVSYGLLRFNNSGFIGSRTGTATLGYSYKLNARDYIGVNYVFGVFRFPGSGTSFNTHIVQASYGHHITGRLAVEMGAGPQINVIKNPITGSSTPLSWSAHASMDYRARKGDLAVNYFRTTTNGGGILPGASTDTVSASWSTQLIRRWSFSFGPGYSHNQSIPQTAAANTESTFNTEYVNASLSRAFGRRTSVFLTYTFQTQSSNFTPCLVGNCQASLLRHVVGFGFDFHPRQITLD